MKIDTSKNTIVCGDNLIWLESVPDNSIDLCYIDPPFFSNRNYEVIWGNGYELRSFGDRFSGGVSHYIEWMRPRLQLIHKKLKANGSIFLHCDWHANHRLRILLDDIFGENNIRNEIVWRRANAHNDPDKFGIITDTILFYGKGDSPKWNPVFIPYSEKYLDSHWRKKDETGRRFRLIPLDAPKHGNGGNLVYKWKGKLPSKNRTWSCVKEKMEILEKENRIAYTKTGTPCLKRYIDETEGLPVQNLWDDIPPVNPMAKERLGYPTQKPEALIRRIIESSSNEGDVILDCFIGGGTTAKVCADLKRTFIVGDVSPVAIRVTAERLRFDCSDVQFEIKNMPKSEKEFKKLKGHDFAALVCEMQGWKVNDRKTSDAGIDGWNSNGEAIQVKNHSKSAAGRPDMQKFYGALAKTKKKRGIFVAWNFSKDAYEYVAEMKREHNVEIVLMRCDEVFKGLIIDGKKQLELALLYKERRPDTWAKDDPEIDAPLEEQKQILEQARQIEKRLKEQGREA